MQQTADEAHDPMLYALLVLFVIASCTTATCAVGQWVVNARRR